MNRPREQGQATVELVALLPALVLLALIGWHVALAAHGWITAAGAARSGARAHEVGAPLERAADAAIRMPGARISAAVAPGGGTRVVVRVPAVRAVGWLPAVPLEGRAQVRQVVPR